MKPGIGRVRCVEKVGTPPDREEKPLAPLPPGRCRRCGEEKSWLRPGETCARCLVPSGPPPRREWDDEEDEVETITLPTNGRYTVGDPEPSTSGGTILRTCPVCGEPFSANATGRPRVYCSMFCKRKQRTEDRPAASAERATCPVCGDTFVSEPGRINCSRACTVRAADQRRRERERVASGRPARRCAPKPPAPAPAAPPPPSEPAPAPVPPPAAAPAHPDDGGWSLIREIGRAFLARVHAQEVGRRS